MSAPGATPGPWAAERCGLRYPDRWNVISHYPRQAGELQEIRRIDQVLDYCGAKEAAANAHLIAASPALYDALENLLFLAEVWEKIDGRKNIQLDNSDTVAAARAALAIARGEAA